jgi:hypothetical protein
MLVSVSAQAGEANEVPITVDEQRYVLSEYLGASPNPASADYGKDVSGTHAPQAYLVKQPPHSHTRPHFHQTNQYQVFVAGGGQLGKLRADPYTVQFAAANTPYGPIQAEAEGVSYFTLRQCWDSGAKYLPAQRDLLVRGQQRQLVGMASADVGAMSRPDAFEEVLIPAAEDGVMAMRYVLPPNESALTPDGSHAGGQYHVVMGGAVVRNGESYGLLSVEFVSPEEGAVPLCAGQEGLDLLVLRFPAL